MKIKVVSPFIVKGNEKEIRYEVGKELEVSKELYEEIKYYVEIINATKKEKNNKVEF